MTKTLSDRLYDTAVDFIDKNSLTLTFGTIGLIGGGIIGATIIAPIATPAIIGIAGIGAIGLTSTAIGTGVVCATSLVTATFSSLVGNFFDKEREKSEQQKQETLYRKNKKNEEEYKRNVARDNLFRVLIDTIPEKAKIDTPQNFTENPRFTYNLKKLSQTEENDKKKTHKILDEIYDSFDEFSKYANFFNETLTKNKNHENTLKELKDFLSNPIQQTSSLQADDKRINAIGAISYFREEEITEEVSSLFKKTTAFNSKMALAIINSNHPPLNKILALNQLKQILFLCTTVGSEEVEQRYKEALKNNDIENMAISKENVDNFVKVVVKHKEAQTPRPIPNQPQALKTNSLQR